MGNEFIIKNNDTELIQQFYSRFMVISQDKLNSITYMIQNQNKIEYMLKEINTNDQLQTNKLRNLIEKKREKNSKMIWKLQQFLFQKQKNYCSNQFRTYLLYERPFKDLHQEILERKIKNTQFAQQQIIQIIEIGILGLTYLKSIDHPHDEIITPNFFITRQGYTMLSDPFLNTEKIINRKLNQTYNSPEKLEMINNLTYKKYDWFTSDLFCLGIVGLQVYNLQFMENLYMKNHKEINYHFIQQKINEIKSLKLKNYISKLISDPNTRAKFANQIYQNYQMENAKNKNMQINKPIPTIFKDNSPIKLNNNINKIEGKKSIQPIKIPLIQSQRQYNQNNHFFQPPKNIIIDNYVPNTQVITSIRLPSSNSYNPNYNLQSNMNQMVVSKNKYQTVYKTNQQPIFSKMHDSTLKQSHNYNGFQILNNPLINPINMIDNPITTTKNVIDFRKIGNYEANNRSLNSLKKGYEDLSNKNLKYDYLSKNLMNQGLNMSNNTQLFKKQSNNNNKTENTFFHANYYFNNKQQSNHNNITSINHYQQKNKNKQQNLFTDPKFLENILGYKTINIQPQFKQIEKFQDNQLQKTNIQLIHTKLNTQQQSESPKIQFNNMAKNLNNDSQSYVSAYDTILQNKKKQIQKSQIKNISLSSINQTNNNSIQQFNQQNNIAPATPTRRVNPNKYISTIAEVTQSDHTPSESHNEADYVTESFQIGSKYEGYKKNGMRNGKGKFYYQDGGYYEGDWKDNKMHGYGKLYYNDMKIAYQGEWFMDEFHGHGKVYNDNPIPLTQSFNYKNFNQLEQYWEYYEGNLMKDCKQGMGKIKITNGEIFEGEFKQDRIEGEGRFYTINGQIISGIWDNQQLIQLL